MKQKSLISIIGMACEFAGQADSLTHFYQAIMDAADATIDIDPDRWRVDSKQIPDLIKHGGYLKRNPWTFDARLFSISPKEAARIDPQHRILLEHTWHAFEDAHIDPKQLKGKRCGVFVGVGTLDYSRIMHASGDLGGYFSKGSLGSMAAGRIAYHFDLTGPNFVVDTACSSSLVALHQAIQSLHNDECDLAVVGGTTLILTNDYNLDLADAGLMAHDGRCKPFSAKADGFARGEGAAVIILQKQENALNENRRIYANILGSAINSDGKTNGITAPSKEAQKNVIKEALINANVHPDQVNLIETHGTGTDLGDRIEFSALAEVFQGRKAPLYIGSVKGNIAHCEAAAGLAGVIKTSLCIYHNTIPPHTAADDLNPDLQLELLPVEFPKHALEKSHLIGSISSFGMSGSNAHVILRSAGQEQQQWGIYPTVFSRTELMPEFLKTIRIDNNVQSTLDLVPARIELQIKLDLLRSNDCYIAQHVINGHCILPGTWYLDTTSTLIQKFSADFLVSQQSGIIEITNLLLIKPVIFQESKNKCLKVVITWQTQNMAHISYYQTGDVDELVCELQVNRPLQKQVSQGMPKYETYRRNSADFFYKDYLESGVNYGPLFQKIGAYYKLDEHNVISEILPADSRQYTISHALFLDNCLQTIGLCLEQVTKAYAPASVASVVLYKNELWNSLFKCHAEIITRSEDYIEANLTVFNGKNECVLSATGVICRAVELNDLNPNDQLYSVQWQPVLETNTIDLEPCALVSECTTENTSLLLASLNQASVAMDFDAFIDGRESIEGHLLYLCPSEIDSLFNNFKRLYDALRAHDDKRPGSIKKLTLISCSHPLVLMQAIALAFPIEFPNIEFRYFCYDTFTKSNVRFLGQNFIQPLDGISAPFFLVKSDKLYQYRTLPLMCMSKTPMTLKTDGYYLLTGGLGGVGKQLLKYMLASMSIKKIIVTYSKPESLAENLAFIEQMKMEHDAHIICQQVDVTNVQELEALNPILPRPLYGIFHLAGITVDQSLAKITPESIAATHDVKTKSAWILHNISLQIPELEHFVLFSSLASLISSPGQFSYALANLGLIDLADHRHGLNLPVKVIDWGPWENTGMMTRLANTHSSVATQSFNPLAPEQCCADLFACMNVPEHYHFAVFKLNKMKQVTIVEEAKLSDVTPTDADYAEQLLVQLIAEETDHECAEIHDKSNLEDLGLDSINTIRIRTELQTQLNLSIPLALLLNERTVGSLKQKLNILWLNSQNGAVTQIEKENSLTKKLTNTFYPLSANQFSIWFEQKALESTTAYNCSIGWHIKGKSIFLDQLQQSWQMLLKTHEMLRAMLTYKEGVPGYTLLSIDEALNYSTLVREQLSEDVDVNRYLQTQLARSIDFTQELATKIYVITQANNIYLMLSSHHIMMDASAMFQLGTQLLRALCVPGFVFPSDLSAVSYDEFTQFQQQNYMPKALDFLSKQVLNENNELRTFSLPKKDNESAINLANGGSIKLEFELGEMQPIMALPTNLRVHVCLSAWALLLAKYSDERELLTGIAFNGRTQKKWTNIIGHFVNVLPLCILVEQNNLCCDFVNQVKSRLFELMEFQDLPLLQLTMQEEVKRALQGRKLLQTYFNYFDATELELDINNPDLQINPLMYSQQEAQFEISLWVTQNRDDFSFEIKYQSDLFSEKMLANLTRHYKRIIVQLAHEMLNQEATLKLRDLKLLTPVEESRLLPILNAEQPTKLVYDLFMNNVHALPDAIAIEIGNQTISYAQLSCYVEEFAAKLVELPRHTDEVVGILSPERANVEFIITVLALWKLGYAFVPINGHHPLERIKYVMDTVSCRKIINISRECPPQVYDYMVQLSEMLVLDLQLKNVSLSIQVTKNDLPDQTNIYIQPISASNLAYVLFTSGSTGLPKGVLIEQGGLIDRLLWMKKYFNYSEHDKFLQSTMLTFDVSLPEYCLPLICGGAVILFHSEDNPQAHAQICERHQVTMMSTVPSLFSVLLNSLQEINSLKHIIMIGEVLPPAMVNQWLSSGTSCKLYNLYGPTEVTVYATAYECNTPVAVSSVPIGSLCDNVIALVLDSYGNLVPEGVVGELYLAGYSVARKYIGGQLKSNPFADNPYQERYPHIYKTGDYVRWLDQHTLDYIGRKDNRIKLHGLLIELGEIEQLVLNAFPDVKNACALIVSSESGSSEVKHIILTLMPAVQDTRCISEHLERYLPQYMLPWKIISFPDFPRNASGKIDRKALLTSLYDSCIHEPKEEIAITNNLLASLSFDEQECVTIWEHLLKKKIFSLDENFFQLGGDSLLLTQMTLMIEEKLDVKINFAKFLTNPTIHSLLNGVSKQPLAWDTEMVSVAQGIKPFEHSRLGNGVFLTGAAGHLGIHILKLLLDMTEKQIFVLIRNSALQEARARLMKRFKEVFSQDLNCSRIHILIGNLAQPMFDLDRNVYSELCDNTSIIIHAAAEVNHIADYARLKMNNVIVTNNMLQFAHASKSEHLFYISTQFSEVNTLPESYLDYSVIEQFVSGYEQSKFIGECLMHKATGLDYPITTLRLPLVIDASDPLLLRQNHFVAFVMKCMRIGFYPDLIHYVDIIPTEQVATFIVQTCTTSGSQSSVYNCLEYKCFLSYLFDYLNKLTKTTVTKMDYETWRTLLINSTDSSDPFYKLLPLYTNLASENRTLDSRKVENKTYLSKTQAKIGGDTELNHTRKIAEILYKYSMSLDAAVIAEN